jgi:hypothetical protein
MSDAELLEEVSTSPAEEQPRFAADIRALVALAGEPNREAAAFGERSKCPATADVNERNEE